MLRFPACAAAFEHPESIEFEGQMISGAANPARLQVASLPNFIIMKAHALASRDKPKDVCDLCYCFDEYPDAIGFVAAGWRSRREDPLVAASIQILREKFKAVEHYGVGRSILDKESGSRCDLPPDITTSIDRHQPKGGLRSRCP